MSEFPIKFLRSHFTKFAFTGVEHPRYLFKLIYEFWGFCIYGSNDLDLPGSGSFAPTGSLSLPTGFENSSTLLSGSDGVTTQDSPFFSSSTGGFTADMVGNHIVTWKSGSTSTDDSIYEITELISTNVIRVDTRAGGTPVSAANNEPFFTARTSINFRVVDFEATFNLAGHGSGTYMVVQVPVAPEINSGSAVPQIKLGRETSGPGMGMLLHPSPSGSWTGTEFTDGQEFYSPTGNSGGWTNRSASTGKITIIGAKDFLFSHGMGRRDSGLDGWHDAGAGVYWEIPERLYPQENDPNPLACMSYGNGLTQLSTDKGFGAFRMVGVDPTNEKLVSTYESYHYTISGMGWPSNVGAAVWLINSSAKDLSINTKNSNFWLTDLFLSRDSTVEYSVQRVRLRHVREIMSTVPDGQIFGSESNNQWFKVFESIVLPWDGARLPYDLLDLG